MTLQSNHFSLSSCDTILYASPTLGNVKGTLNFTVTMEREKLQQQTVPYIERWEWVGGDDVTMVVTMRETENGLLRKWQI